MPGKKITLRTLGVAAMLVAALGLGMLVGTPDSAVAQEDTTSTTLVDDSTATTADEAPDPSTDDSVDDPAGTQRPGRGDDDCADRAGSTDDGTSEDSSQSGA